MLFLVYLFIFAIFVNNFTVKDFSVLLIRLIVFSESLGLLIYNSFRFEFVLLLKKLIIGIKIEVI
ncbi:hypothetical protein SDAV_00639 [Spiroplasma phoeniceum P40]|uniref:Uncharacterized protein n=1 Tax=Spiroplasma phoeniceum P40 TaxID=1276259 RepID=A0A345DN42_9MOLU|nr:hypothetical protein SDAV_00639 [Spiroplasma phoeniceum P40]